MFRLEGTNFSDTQYVEYKILKTITIMKGKLEAINEFMQLHI